MCPFAFGDASPASWLVQYPTCCVRPARREQCEDGADSGDADEDEGAEAPGLDRTCVGSTVHGRIGDGSAAKLMGDEGERCRGVEKGERANTV